MRYFVNGSTGSDASDGKDNVGITDIGLLDCEGGYFLDVSDSGYTPATGDYLFLAGADWSALFPVVGWHISSDSIELGTPSQVTGIVPTAGSDSVTASTGPWSTVPFAAASMSDDDTCTAVSIVDADNRVYCDSASTLLLGLTSCTFTKHTPAVVVPPTTSGVRSRAMGYLKDMLVDCPTFALIVPVNTEDHVHDNALPPPSNGEYLTKTEYQTYRPFAILSTTRFQGRADGANASGASGTAYSIEHVIQIERNTPAGDAIVVGDEWERIVSAIEDELNARKGLAGFLAATSIEATETSRSHPTLIEDFGDFQYAMFRVRTEVE
jgi:hypothetical protein